LAAAGAVAIVCGRGQWVCNEKRRLDRAGLSSLDVQFAEIPRPVEGLVR
jgi:hypothetical protein